jgi:hypothetical protein
MLNKKAYQIVANMFAPELPKIGDILIISFSPDEEREHRIIGEDDDSYHICDCHGDNIEHSAAEYHGREVPLNKPMKGDVKKSKVYVKNKSGRVIKVNFGDPNMRIKKNIPARRKSFRARHHCETAHDKTTPRYGSCKSW